MLSKEAELSPGAPKIARDSEEVASGAHKSQERGVGGGGWCERRTQPLWNRDLSAGDSKANLSGKSSPLTF